VIIPLGVEIARNAEAEFEELYCGSWNALRSKVRPGSNRVLTR
jgi:hypothetical protein